MQKLTDSFGLPAAIGLFAGTVLGLFIKNFYIGLGVGFIGAVVYVAIKHKKGS